MSDNSNPFPLSTSDRNAFINDVGYSALGSMPDWGSIFVWRNRVVLAFMDASGEYRLTDITMGIPSSRSPTGYIDASVLIQGMPKTQTSSFGVFMYSLPQNFLDVAVERMKQLVGAAGEVAGSITGEIAKAAAPLEFPLIAIGGIAVVVLYFMYGPRRR